MQRYLLKRLLIFFPSLVLVTLLCFWLAASAPGDAAQQAIGIGEDQQSSNSSLAEYLALRKKMGLALPLFYFSISNAALPDTLYRIPDSKEREAMERMCETTGLPEAVALYCHKLSMWRSEALENVNAAPLDKINELVLEGDVNRSKRILDGLAADTCAWAKQAGVLRALLPLKSTQPYLHFLPVLRWHGLNNQYHRWLAQIATGDLGVSYQDQRPVAGLLIEALKRTLLLCGSALLISLLIAVPLGIYTAVHAGSRIDRGISGVLFFLHAIPNFWLASMMIVFFCGGDYLDVFPAFGWSSLDADASLWSRVWDAAWHLLLPVLCLMYAGLAYLARQVRGSMLAVLPAEFIQTARAKGLSEHAVVWRHAFRNSLLPLITIIAGMLPMVISGSFVIECLFSIPGVGKLTYEAVLARNFPVVYGSVLLVASFTIVAMLLADLLYAWADPRISFSSQQKGGADE